MDFGFYLFVAYVLWRFGAFDRVRWPYVAVAFSAFVAFRIIRAVVPFIVRPKSQAQLAVVLEFIRSLPNIEIFIQLCVFIAAVAMISLWPALVSGFVAIGLSMSFGSLWNWTVLKPIEAKFEAVAKSWPQNGTKSTNVHPAANDEPVVFTDEERDAVERHLKMCISIMDRDKPSEHGAWAVTHRFKSSLVAQGLWHYADQLLSSAMRCSPLEFYKTSDSRVAELLRRAMIARVKAVKIFPLPIGFYHVAVLAAALNEPDAARMLSGFVDEQSKYVPDDMEAKFVKDMGWDIPTAVSDARKRLDLD